MCGLAGRASTDVLGPESLSVLHAAGRFLAPRGPDDQVIVRRPHFEIVFRRLAVNDLTAGRQPFTGDGGRIVVAVNGEIYNHRELMERLPGPGPRTRSDCEVVLHLYRHLGTGFLPLLNGIFAIAVWDERNRRLILARDRLGVKPLYHASVGRSILFGSELKAVLAYPGAPRTLDWQALRHVPNAAFPFPRPGAAPVSTGVHGVSFVEPATWVEWCDGVTRAHRYWRPAEPEDTLADPVGRYADLLDDSVRLELMSDTPVGIFVSGGLDSSLLLATAARRAPDLEAYTLVEPSIRGTGDIEAAADLCRQLGVAHHMVRVDQAALEETVAFDLAMLEHFVWIMDFPVFDPEFLVKHELHRRLKTVRPESKVVLLGQGADEFAGGYSTLGFQDWPQWCAHNRRLLHESLLGELGMPDVYRPLVSERSTEERGARATGAHEAWQVIGASDLAAYNLWHEDRTAAANGVEARVPYLDHRIVDLLCSVPRERHAELFFDKEIMRRAAGRHLAERFTRRPKVPLLPEAAPAAALVRRLATGAFAEFRERYLDSGRSLFAPAAMAELHRLATGSPMADRAGYLLLRCMAISVFDRICDGVSDPAFEPPVLHRHAEPLAVAA
ncbi:asparagine synthase (glutamine-hydrolyzing) [Actinoplanes sp. NEAU-A12]|uniref:asparagine synthase (glutamine-hydrolyzing) n=1 Tax=Actinoplanes sandaracinus TaxID=3045177 RepID=A0ABT6WUG4_9ACTN|nr:asparagine synthase (glutamine-hydrolyzing) [Actinoplanes sandaracinus]MDI6103350.1 asparagine synthase (glutamine-hydrolyzing) [Actinoplanes sandaracinus]